MWHFSALGMYERSQKYAASASHSAFIKNTPETEDSYLKTALNYYTLTHMLRAAAVMFSIHKK